LFSTYFIVERDRSLRRVRKDRQLWPFRQSQVFRLASGGFSASASRGFPEAPLVLPPPVVRSPAAAELEQADRSFGGGIYDEAAQAYENYLRAPAPGCPCDQELVSSVDCRMYYATRIRTGCGATAIPEAARPRVSQQLIRSAANLILALRSELQSHCCRQRLQARSCGMIESAS